MFIIIYICTVLRQVIIDFIRILKFWAVIINFFLFYFYKLKTVFLNQVYFVELYFFFYCLIIYTYEKDFLSWQHVSENVFVVFHTDSFLLIFFEFAAIFCVQWFTFIWYIYRSNFFVPLFKSSLNLIFIYCFFFTLNYIFK